MVWKRKQAPPVIISSYSDRAVWPRYCSVHQCRTLYDAIKAEITLFNASVIVWKRPVEDHSSTHTVEHLPSTIILQSLSWSQPLELCESWWNSRFVSRSWQFFRNSLPLSLMLVSACLRFFIMPTKIMLTKQSELKDGFIPLTPVN